jgi:hypothetical protein
MLYHPLPIFDDWFYAAKLKSTPAFMWSRETKYKAIIQTVPTKIGF